MSVITVENLRYRYPHTKELALDGLDFSVEKGEFIKELTAEWSR